MPRLLQLSTSPAFRALGASTCTERRPAGRSRCCLKPLVELIGEQTDGSRGLQSVTLSLFEPSLAAVLMLVSPAPSTRAPQRPRLGHRLAAASVALGARALVVGGTGRVGGSTAKWLRRFGADVTVAGRRRESYEQLRKRWEQAPEWLEMDHQELWRLTYTDTDMYRQTYILQTLYHIYIYLELLEMGFDHRFCQLKAVLGP